MVPVGCLFQKKTKLAFNLKHSLALHQSEEYRHIAVTDAGSTSALSFEAAAVPTDGHSLPLATLYADVAPGLPVLCCARILRSGPFPRSACRKSASDQNMTGTAVSKIDCRQTWPPGLLVGFACLYQVTRVVQGWSRRATVAQRGGLFFRGTHYRME